VKYDKRRRPQRSGGQADTPAKQQPRQQARRQQTGVHPGPRYGILGGTFDPPHLGHLALAQEVYVRLALDRVWFLPAGVPPHKTGKVISPAADRLAMLERAVAADERFGVLTVELERAGPSYTVDTLRELRTLWGADAEMVLILGWDMLEYLPKWHDAAGVVAGADKIAVVHRPGFIAEESDLVGLEHELPGLREKLALVPLPQLAISGTEIRSRVAHMLPIRYLTPDPVATYIESRALYRTAEHTVEHTVEQTDGPPNDQPDERMKGGER
jgi:nicotinate-nucleotide adenylyltransferase